MTGYMKNVWKKAVSATVFLVILLSLTVGTAADSLLVNHISHASESPSVDAAFVPDFEYGKTAAMYVRTPFVDDGRIADLSDMTGTFYAVWKDSRLYFHFIFKNFSLDDGFTLYFDFDNSEDGVYGEDRTVSVTFLNTEEGLILSQVGRVSHAGDTEAFISSAEIASSSNGSLGFCGEICLDFGALYEDINFSANYRLGFDIEAFDTVDRLSVRYCWNDDTGSFTETPRSLGTLVLKAPLYVEDVAPTPLPGEEEDPNPGTSDSDAVMCGVICFCALFMGLAMSCRIKI